MNKRLVDETSPFLKRFTSISYLSKKLKTFGVQGIPQWFFQKLVMLFREKTRVWRAKRSFKKEMNGAQRNQVVDDVLYAYYDLEISPVCFDFGPFIVQAEIARKDAGCKKLHVVIIPASTVDGLQNYNDRVINREEENWRIRNMLVQCAWIIPSCVNVTVCSNRLEGAVINRQIAKYTFPIQYSLEVPVPNTDWRELNKAHFQGKDVRPFAASLKAKQYVGKYLKLNAGARKVITIGLRECSYSTDRNSNLKEWIKFARSLDKETYFVVFVRDIETIYEPVSENVEEFAVFSDAVWNLEIRTALYELSYVVMSVNNGPNVLCYLNKHTRYLIYKVCTPTVNVTTEDHMKKYIEIERGESYKMADKFQRIIWEDDDFKPIKQAFEVMDGDLKEQYGLDFRPHLLIEEGNSSAQN